MARIDNPLFKGLKGKIGGLIFYERDGQTFVRSKPDGIKDAKTPLQLNQRKKMELVNDFLRPFKRLLKRTFVDPQSEKRAYNLAKSYNLLNGTSGFADEMEINYQTALLCKGPLVKPQQVGGEKGVNGIVIKWKYVKGEGSPYDNLLVMMRHKTYLSSDFLFTGAMRNDEKYYWQFDGNYNVQDYHFWLAFTDRMGEEMSNSVYVELIQ
ncbi:DUF6266 family protein [Carboxylicivirga sp. M1479]|uniref:DUF6266 family protein n=1 Tax=Carboxylicivirga sp. M1479 TaxID=2594476 RepID=UPI001177BB2C|nr:DUF6266 family protein [Carboxylicivirga sp. M1479]TRX72072.1 hypothetical protein FNN09_03445 [Carboxylicivirga sp. M1479]